MVKTIMAIKLDIEEKQELKKLAASFGYNLSEYVKYKLFDGNIDLENCQTEFISPAIAKNNILTISVLYKILYLTKEILIKQGNTKEQAIKLEQDSLEYARQQREIHGFKIIEKQNK